MTTWTTTKSPRAALMIFLKEEAKKLRGGEYFVKRGVVNWPIFFERGGVDHAIAILMDEGTVLPDTTDSGLFNAQISLEVFSRTNPDPDQGLDDALLDCMIEDISYLMTRVLVERTTIFDKIAFHIERSTTRFTEIHDLDRGIQGIVATFRIKY